MDITASQLAHILSEEFEREQWGAIEPIIFKRVNDDRESGDDPFGETEGMITVLTRVANQLNEL